MLALYEVIIRIRYSAEQFRSTSTRAPLQFTDGEVISESAAITKLYRVRAVSVENARGLALNRAKREWPDAGLVVKVVTMKGNVNRATY